MRSEAGDLFDAGDGFKRGDTRKFFTQYMAALAQWVEAIVGASRREDFESFMSADARMGKADERVQMKLRVTELFRFQEGGWKLIHRHADAAADRPH